MTTIAPAIAVPPILPGGLKSLSHSSIAKYLKCPESWRRSYLEGQWDPSGGPAILGSAIHAANAEFYRSRLYSPGNELTVDEVLDAFATSWDVELDENDIDWRDDKPGELKDLGVPLLKRYHELVAPNITPVAVEREFRVQPAGVEWFLKGYIDLEYRNVTTTGRGKSKVETVEEGIADYKVIGKSKSQAEMDADPQPTMYTLARRAEGREHKRFDFHVLNRKVKTEAAMVKVGTTLRTDDQLDRFYTRILTIAAEIQWRAENDVWGGAVPGSWYCSRNWCSHWAECTIR